MSILLRKYIRQTLLEADVNPAVANQLPGTPKSGEKGKESKDEVEELDEFSGAGAVAGMTLPLGMKTPGKKKRPAWK